MKTHHRPFGVQICAAVQQVEAQGVCTYAHIHVEGLARENVHKVLSRAVGLGLLTTDRSVRPRTFSVTPNWQDRLERHPTTRPKAIHPRGIKAIQPITPLAPKFSSVWVAPVSYFLPACMP